MRTGLEDRAALAGADRPRPLPRHARQPAADRPAGQGRPARVRRELRAGSRSRARPSRPRIDAVLDRGTAQLRAAGFSSRSAFLTSPTFGGLSWLAHSTLQSGVQVDGQRRYDQLVAERPPHPHAGVQARRLAGGRRHAGEPPATGRRARPSTTTTRSTTAATSATAARASACTADARPVHVCWPCSVASSPSAHRPPLFAEVDLISSHVPWTRIPRLIPWDEVGDGSIFDRVPPKESTRAALFGEAATARARLRALDRVLAEHALLVRAALRRRRTRAGRPGRPPARDARHRPGREPRRADLGHRPRPEGDGPDRRMGLAGRHAAEPAGAGLADGRVPRPLPRRASRS